MELLRDDVSGSAANICMLSFPHGSLPPSQQSLAARQSCNITKSLRGEISPRPLHRLQWPSATSQHRLYCFILSEKNSLAALFLYFVSFETFQFVCPERKKKKKENTKNHPKQTNTKNQ